MKKNILLTLVSLVIFAGSAWGNYKFSYPKEVTLASAIGESKSISLGGTANITAFACSLKTENKLTYQNMLIGSTNGGSDLYKGNPGGGSSTSFIYHSTEVSCSTATIYFEHPALCAKRTCKNMVFTIATATPSIADAILFSTTTCTFNVFSGTAISTANFTSTDTNFAVTAVSLVKDYCYSVTISFSPTNVGSYSSTIKLNGEDAATVSATGLLPTPTTALDATDVTFNSFTANWEASDLEGAKYTIEVKDANDNVIASASGLEETSYAVSELDPESDYTYVVYVVVGDATSEASNTISVTTLAKPAIIPAQDEYKLTSDTGIEGYTSIIITAVNVTEATATVTGDAEFYFKDADGNPVTTKTLPIEAEGPTEFELYSMFTAGGEYSATVTISATDADDAIVSVTATATLVVPATTALDATDVTF
ncbi:MAG: fibronectin type III domain-containing protein, partial [Paludibacteraceae bacterium]|nr:fibronectin type III domain-containing protein [Paludibacteraceae bacterium]